MPAIFTAIARGDCEVYEISQEALRQVLNQCPTVSDIILSQAFIARPATGARVAGFHGSSGDRITILSPDTFRVRDFLSRNRVALCCTGWMSRLTRRSTSC